MASAIIAMLGLTALVVWLDPWLYERDHWLTLSLLNTAPLLILGLLFFAVFRRVWPAAFATALVAWLLYTINAVKLHELKQPLLFTDILLTPQVINNTELLARYSQPGMVSAVLLGFLFAIGVSLWLEKAKGGWRSATAIAIVAVLTSWTITHPPINQAFARHGALDTPWSPIASVKNTGLIASLAASAGKDLVDLPEPNWEQVEALLETHADELTGRPSTAPMPDIVVILSESFFDPSILNNVDPCVYLPRWCEYTAHNPSGFMQVPTFGGNTTRTEYEVLTGIPYATLPTGVYPYTSVVRKRSASLPWWLRSLGYQATAIHPHSRTFWQRHRAYPLLGFQRFIAEDDMPGFTRVGWFVSDEDMTDHMLAALQEAEASPQLLFAVSMENHGPWNKPRPGLDSERLAAIATPESLPDAARLAWQQYIYHAENSLEQLNRLKIALEQRQRPYVLLFFGDHLPNLDSVYSELGFRNQQTAHQQFSPYLFFSNFDGGQLPGKISAAHHLPIRLLQRAGLPLPAHYAAIAALLDNEATASQHIDVLHTALLHTEASDWQHQATP
jgi:phosphoglycerol transferase MdoB-like AlkP superfamily enzyme